MEAEVAASVGTLVGRTTAILLAAQAVEMTLIVVRGREASQLGRAIEEVAASVGRLGTHSAAEALGKARVAVQHSGVVPDEQGTLRLVTDGSAFCDEVLVRVFGVALHELHLAAGVPASGLRHALESAEDFLTRGELREAAIALARARHRLPNAAEILTWKKPQMRQRLSTSRWGHDIRQMFGREFADWTEEVTRRIESSELRERVGLTLREEQRLADVLPACSSFLSGDERVFLPDSFAPNRADVSWALNVLVRAALGLPSPTTDHEEWQLSQLAVPEAATETIEEQGGRRKPHPLPRAAGPETS